VTTPRISHLGSSETFDLADVSAWQLLIDLTGEFQEGLVAKVEIVGGYVFDDSTFRARDGQPVDIIVAVQFQDKETPAVLLRFSDVERFEFGSNNDFPSRCTPQGELFEWTFLNCKIVARNGFAVTGGEDWLGTLRNAHLFDEIDLLP
jgi:hypothetical protein